MPLELSLDMSVFGQVELDLINRKFNSAMMRLTSMSLQFSKNPIYLRYLCQALRAIGDQMALVKTLKELNRQESNPEIEIEIMDLLYKNAHINEALDIALILQEKPLSANQRNAVHLTLMKIYIEENDFEGVQEILDQGARLMQTNDFVLWAQGLVQLSNGDKNQALQSFRKAIHANDRNDQAWVSLALVHFEMGDEELALGNLEQALDCNPLNNAAVKLYSQWALRKTDKAKKALHSIRFYLSEHGFDEEISWCHVQLLCGLKHFNAATAELNKLILTHPQNLNYTEMKKNLAPHLNV